MRKLAIFAIMALITLSATAQRVFRSEYLLYDTREDALAANSSNTVNHIPFVPKSMGALGEIEMFGMKVEVPASWNDYNGPQGIEIRKELAGASKCLETPIYRIIRKGIELIKAF